jgi:hypothetical protein
VSEASTAAGTPAKRSVSGGTSWKTCAGAWQAELSERLGGHATITIAAIDAGSPALASSTQARLEVIVHWAEGSRHRRVRLSVVRM